MNYSSVINYFNLNDFYKGIISGSKPEKFKLTISYQDQTKKYKIPVFFLEKFDYFNNLIKFNKKYEAKIDVASEETGNDLVEYIITGVITFNEGISSNERLESLYEIADMLQLTDLTKICESFLEKKEEEDLIDDDLQEGTLEKIKEYFSDNEIPDEFYTRIKKSVNEDDINEYTKIIQELNDQIGASQELTFLLMLIKNEFSN